MEEKKIKGVAKLRYILFLMKPYWKYGKVYYIVSMVMAVLFQPFSTYLTTLMPKAAIDGVARGKTPKEIVATIGLYTLGIALIAAMQKIIMVRYTRMTQTKIDNKIRNDVNEKALFTDFKYYDNPDFFTKFMFAQEKFPDQARNVMFAFPGIVQGVVTILAMGAVMAVAGPVVLGVTLAFVLLNAVIGLPTLKPEADAHVQFTEAWRPFQYVSRLLKQKENAAELRSSGAGLKFLQAVDVSTKRYQSVYQNYTKKVLPFQLVQGILSPVQAASVLACIVIFVIDGDTTKIGLYASLTAASAALVTNLDGAFGNIQFLLQSTLHGERIAAFFEAKSEIEPIQPGKLPPPEGVYDIAFQDVSFGYDNASFGIEHLDLHILPGQRVAIVGENGAGKSTLTKLLLRLYDVTGGALLLNGINIKDYAIHDLRLHIGIAFQDVRVLAMSLRDNLTVYNDVPEEKLLAVIEKLGLEGVLEKVGGNLDTMVSREFTEDGAVLSGGEAQRVSLARLFTGQFGLLVLDEPSSALDPMAEYKLMQTILDASNTATTLMIAHRLSTVRNFDRIYHMENGKIIEGGTHDDLMAAHGKYYEMFTRQAENYQSAE
ncbi:MAG: ABC transporter ATP-binding protein/permease [Oscillospiraceae bacterium]|jgi:ATP-binding cassette subfamily B protein|nr:ABC transporter ATP-binding protein/permease [Oscillospiraceae bacterium]